MVESHLPVEEGLPAIEIEQARPNRLTELKDRLKARPDMPAPPDIPPPITLEQLVSAEAAVAERKNAAKERKKARKQLEKVYKQTEKAPELAEPAVMEEVEIERVEEPTEADYERRAEVKSEPDVKDDQGLAEAMNKILEEIKKKTATAHEAFSKVKPPKVKLPKLPKGPKIGFLSDLPELYQRAVTMGLAGGLLVVLVLVVVTSL
jgi:hypothetical protein